MLVFGGFYVAWFGDIHACQIMDLGAETVQKDRFLTPVSSLIQLFTSFCKFKIAQD